MNAATSAATEFGRSANPFEVIPFAPSPSEEGVRESVEMPRKVLIVATRGTVRGGVVQALKARFELEIAKTLAEAEALLKRAHFLLAVVDWREASLSEEALVNGLRMLDGDMALLVLCAGRQTAMLDNLCLRAPFDASDLLDSAIRLSKLSARRRERSQSIRQLEGTLTLLQEELQAKESIASYGEASASMVHDLRNALFSTLGYTAQLIRETAQLKSDLPDKAEPIDRIANKLEHTSNYLFHLSQTCRYNGHVETQHERFGLMTEVRHVHKYLFFSSPNVSIEGVEAPVIGDRFELHRVLQNLFKNAFEAGAEKVVVRIGVEGRTVVLGVIDDGNGFSAEDADLVFHRSLVNSKRGGHGLGLRICRQIVERMGGRITLSSTLGAGSEFTIRLPLAEDGWQDGGFEAGRV